MFCLPTTTAQPQKPSTLSRHSVLSDHNPSIDISLIEHILYHQDDAQERSQAVQPDRRSCRGFRSCRSGMYLELSSITVQTASVFFLQLYNARLDRIVYEALF